MEVLLIYVSNERSFRLRVCKRKSQMFVLIPALCSTPYLHGRAKVTVVKGSVSVLTHQLRPGTQYDVFSPSSGSLLALTCVDSLKIKAEEVRAELAKFGIPENDKDVSVYNFVSVRSNRTRTKTKISVTIFIRNS